MSKPADKSKLDNQLASGDFLPRLCLVKLSDNDNSPDAVPSSIAPGRLVETLKLWPAIKFSSNAELLAQIKKTVEEPHATMMCGWSTVNMARARRATCPNMTAQEANACGVAYLLGQRSKSQPAFVWLTENEEVFDFCTNYLEMEDAKGEHCGSEEFQTAFKLAARRMGEDVEGGGEGSVNFSPSPSKVKREKVATMTTINSGQKLFSNVEYSPQAKQKKREFTTKKEATENGEETMSAHFKSPPVKMVEFSGANGSGSVSSPEKPPSTGGSVSSPEKYTDDEEGHSEVASSAAKTASVSSSLRKRSQRCSPAPHDAMPWKDMLDKMKSEGWTHMTGHDLIAWIYVHPTLKGKKKHAVLKEGVEGETYFTSEEAVKRYAARELGWKSADPRDLQSVDSPKDAEMADRIKKRKRAVQNQAVKPAEAKPVAKAKKSQTKTAAKKSNGKPFQNWVKTVKATEREKQKQARLEREAAEEKTSKAKKPVKAEKKKPSQSASKKKPASPAKGSSDDEESRFSEGFSSPEQETSRSGTESLTFSELEANVGIQQSARKKKTYSKKSKDHELATQEQEESEEEESEEGSEEENEDFCKSEDEDDTSASESPSEQSSVDETYQVMPSRMAWNLLMDHFGFTFHGGKYCYPGKENRPGKDSNATEGENYFDSIENLRKHLCKWGLPEIKKFLSDEVVINLGRWVRYAHVMGLQDGALINPDDIEQINFAQAWRMLQKAGCKYSTLGYRVPDVDPFDQQEDFMKHLARFGLPRVDGIKLNEVIDADERLLLDLYIATTDVDSFKRIDPKGGDIHEVTPRRARRSRNSNATQSELAMPVEQTRPLAAQQKQALNHRVFQMEFNKLKQQRTLPEELLSMKEALAMLVDNYNFSVQERDGTEFYCLPNVSLNENEEEANSNSIMLDRDYFETVQDMRENLCAFGLPPMAKGSKMSDTMVEQLGGWIRCANIDALSVDSATVPKFMNVKPKLARTVLKNLGYRHSNNYDTFFLPGVSMHKSISNKNRFEKISDLIDYIARCGLDTDKPDSEMTVSEEDKLNLQVFVASVTKFDVCKRIKCDAPIKKRSREIVNKREVASSTDVPAAAAAKAAFNTEQEAAFQNNKATDSADVAGTPSHPPAVVVDDGDQDTPQPSPPKKARPNPITSYFTAGVKKVADAMVTAFSPSKRSSSSSASSPPPTDQPKAESSPASSSLDKLSPSCIDTKGDDEVEAYLAGTPENDDQASEEGAIPEYSVENNPENDLTSALNQVSTAGQQEDSYPKEASSNIQHYPQAESPDMTWTELWSQMRKAGWHYHTGDGLIGYYWCHPSTKTMGKRDMIRDCSEGVHYFTTDKAIHQYAMRHLGWLGDGKAKFESSPTPSDMSMTTRVKRRRQQTDKNSLNSDESQSPPKRHRASARSSHDAKITQTKPTPSPVKESQSSPRSEKNSEKSAEKSPCKAPRPSDDQTVNSSHSSYGEEVCKAIPDKESDVRGKLQACKLVCHPSFKKSELSKSSPTSVVSSMEHEIEDFMTKSIQTGTIVDGLTLPSPGFMYICGGPGTGKTTAVSSCAENRKKWAKNHGYEKPHFCSINMATMTSTNVKGGIMRAMLKKIASAIKIDKEAALQTFENQFKKKVVVLILDEVDMLFKKHMGIGEQWFRTLVAWAEDKEMRFSMISISNCVNDVNANRVREIGHSPRELVFPAYTEEDILAILQQRVGMNIVDLKALQLISKRVAASSGDARKALEITSNAVGKVLDALTEEKLDVVVEHDDTECMPLVKLPHMMRAIREAMPVRHADVIASLPQAARVVLCVAVSLSQVWGPAAEISVSTLKNYCVQATHHAVMDELGVGQIMNLVVMLIDSGLLVTENNCQFNPHDAHAKLKLGVQMDDVEIALEESLLKEGGFYKRLVDYVKTEYPCPPSP